MNSAIIAIGSNIEPDRNISKMLDLLKEEVEIIQVSKMIKTKPIGITEQSDFTNGTVKIKTQMSDEELNKRLKKIEDLLGRDRTVPKFGPRTIDLDILVFNDEIVDNDFYSRDFLRQSAEELGFKTY